MFLIIGLITGAVLGLTGSGGSLFAVPLLLFLTDVSLHQAVGLSLAVVAASAAFGAIRYILKQQVHWVLTITLVFSGAVTVPIGQFLGRQLPESILTLGFSLLACTIAYSMWVKATRQPELASITRSSDLSMVAPDAPLCRLSLNGQFQLKPRCLAGLVVGGIVIGLLSGLLGVGGGFIIVPLLVFLSQINMKQAVGTSLIVISIVSSIGFVNSLRFYHATDNAISYHSMGVLVIGGLLGMLLGQLLTHKVSNVQLQKVFSVAMFLMAFTMVANSFLMRTSL